MGCNGKPDELQRPAETMDKDKKEIISWVCYANMNDVVSYMGTLYKLQLTCGPELLLNVEGLTKAKSTIMEHLTQEHEVTAIRTQETHSMKASTFMVSGFNPAACTNCGTQSMGLTFATYIRNSGKWKPIASSYPECNDGWTATEIEVNIVVSVCNPPFSLLQGNSLPG
ncbi:unnamed protein product [Clavelina lepadiformis]|uniref:Uncharacterized protein n=1 Tax=Clavelina lepadiformis TaxID=159417 RepID=A0ABP0FUK2_CLALP